MTGATIIVVPLAGDISYILHTSPLSDLHTRNTRFQGQSGTRKPTQKPFEEAKIVPWTD